VTAVKGTALALVLVAVFALVTVSVVRARDPIDDSVSHSFDSRALKRAAEGATIHPLGCRKRSLNYYDCSATVTPGAPRGAPPQVTYRLVLRDDGCWTATGKSPGVPATLPGVIQSCLED
jgi:hypothetical protein